VTVARARRIAKTLAMVGQHASQHTRIDRCRGLMIEIDW
jgi:hypothetical protein